MKQIQAKLGNMRKAESFVVYPRPTDVGADYNLLKIQSDHRMCLFDPTTGQGKLSPYCANYANFTKGSSDVMVPKDVIEAAIAAQPKRGDAIGGGVYIA